MEAMQGGPKTLNLSARGGAPREVSINIPPGKPAAHAPDPGTLLQEGLENWLRVRDWSSGST